MGEIDGKGTWRIIPRGIDQDIIGGMYDNRTDLELIAAAPTLLRERDEARAAIKAAIDYVYAGRAVANLTTPELEHCKMLRDALASL